MLFRYFLIKSHAEIVLRFWFYHEKVWVWLFDITSSMFYSESYGFINFQIVMTIVIYSSNIVDENRRCLKLGGQRSSRDLFSLFFGISLYCCGQKLRWILNLNVAGWPIRANSFIFMLDLLLLTSVPNFMSMLSFVT